LHDPRRIEQRITKQKRVFGSIPLNSSHSIYSYISYLQAASASPTRATTPCRPVSLPDKSNRWIGSSLSPNIPRRSVFFDASLGVAEGYHPGQEEP
jgi:hypothetical protein